MRCTSHSKLRYISHLFSQCDVRRIGLWGVALLCLVRVVRAAGKSEPPWCKVVRAAGEFEETGPWENPKTTKTKIQKYSNSKRRFKTQNRGWVQVCMAFGVWPPPIPDMIFIYL